MSRRRTTSRRAFTLLELLLSIALAGIILPTLFGLVTHLQRTDQALALKYKGMSTLSNTQDVMRRAMQSLVAAPTPNVIFGQDELSRSDDTGTTKSRANEGKTLRLHLRMIDPDDEYDAEDPRPRRLEVVLMAPPMAELNWQGAPIRGAFELYPRINLGETPGAQVGQRIWSLVWQPLEPAGEPVLLMDDLEFAEIMALDGGGLHTIYESYYSEEFPWAIRVVLWTIGGARADWMLEPGVRTGEVLGEVVL
ncbi:MAG: prepilin-type N-terminal cleavage/methylation domain-containing protein [Planctomycetota bacterium]|jgi:prepilin-type N-terminal cleavage/methylation domain-containing protein